MNVAGFVLYDSILFPSREFWAAHISKHLVPEFASRTLAVAPMLEFWKMFERDGFAASAELTTEINKLSNTKEPEFSKLLDLVSSQLLQVIDKFTGGEQANALIPRIIPAQSVLAFIKENNPLFDRWVQFQSERPRKSPADWEQYAVAGLEEVDHEYAILMRNLGQTLEQLGTGGHKLTVFVAEGLKHSHNLEGPDRDLNTAVWIRMAEEDSL